MPKKILITGGAGFVGTNLIRLILNETDCFAINLDKLTYAGQQESLRDVSTHHRYSFERIDIADKPAVDRAFRRYQPDWVINLAAETHVDRSIASPQAFVQTNVVGTFNLLQSATDYLGSLTPERCDGFRLLHISTDEVFGSLQLQQPDVDETSRYDPSSPYAASKAAADHLVRAWHRTYGLPVLITHSSNNHGPFQFPEKLVPVVVLNAIQGRCIPVYGNGENIRDWLYVEDHARALLKVIESGRVGETYNICGNNSLQNINLVWMLCRILDDEAPIRDNHRLSDKQKASLESYGDLIEFVSDRPGHDQRYGISGNRIKSELGWQPLETSQSGFLKTVRWYLENESWWSRICTTEG